MKKSKFKLATLFMSVVMAMSVLVGCGSGNAGSENGTTAAESSMAQEATTAYVAQDIKVAALKGPTAIGMVKLMDDAKNKTSANNYDFTIAASADEFTSLLVSGEIQIAALPCNAAATLYNKSNGKIRVLGINTLGVLYILENGNTINSLADLKGKTIYTTGKGTTPEYTLRYLLTKAGIDPDKDVTIEFKSEASEVAATMQKEGAGAVAMLPQPYVTTLTTASPDIRIALDVTEQWEKTVNDGSTVVTGVIAVNSAYYDSHKEAVDKFMQEYEASVSYVNANVDAAAQLVEDFDIFKAAVAKKAIPYCNITYVTGSQAKSSIEKYLSVLYDQNPQAVGGSLPDSNFYIQ
jgi:NitT/TauT family transport system substrate-binding protein